MAQSLLSATPALLPPSPRTLHKTFNGKHRISSLSSRFIKLRSVCSATNNHHPSLSGIRSGRFWSQFSVSPDIWSIKRDLKIPSSPYCNTYAQGSQGPPHDRIIRCGGPVDDEMAKFLIAQLLYLDAADPTRDIIMYINSPGGSVTAGMAIFDTMRHVRPDVATVCVGISASMGAFLLAAGTKGKRYSLSNSRIMIHQPLGGTQGQQTDVEIQANEILYHKANLAGYLAYFSGQTIERINTDTDRHYFMSPKQAKEYGLVDSVIMNPRCLLNQNQLLLDLVTLPKMI